MRFLHLLTLPALLLLLACPGADPGPCDIGDQPSLTGGHPLDPFPSMHLMSGPTDDPADCRLALEPGTVPVGDGDPMDPARFNRRDGFSPVGTIVWQPGVAVDPGNLPGLLDPSGSLEASSPVQLIDLDTGERFPCFVEIDAYPSQADDQRVLLVRPMRGLGFGTHVGVAVGDSLLATDGGPVPSPAAFASIRDGRKDDAVSQPVRDHYDALLGQLEEHGLDREQLVLAWDFRTATRDNLLAPFDRVVSSMRQELPLDPTFQPDVVLTSVDDADLGDDVVDGLWRDARGSIQLTHWLWDEDGAPDATDDDHDGGWFQLDEEGLPVARATDDAYFVAVLPDSIRDAEPGTVPVLVFGHGIFARPNYYLAASTDGNGTIDLCNRLGAICIGGEWRGLTGRDMADALRVARELGRFPLITDKLIQGVSNQLALARVLRTGFVDADWLQAEGGGSLVDPERIFYFGISLGGIEGATLLANSEVVEHGVLHVPGAAWATMLERSMHWLSFEEYVVGAQPDAAHRQRVYALTQLLWDPVDPINHVEGLAGASALWQVSIGDEQVPNFTAEILARTAGAALVGEPVEEVFGLDVLADPQGPGALGMAQFDGGFVRPALENRPAPETGAHTSIRHTEPMKEQILSFFAPGQEGTIVHPCDGPCVMDLARDE